MAFGNKAQLSQRVDLLEDRLLGAGTRLTQIAPALASELGTTASQVDTNVGVLRTRAMLGGDVAELTVDALSGTFSIFPVRHADRVPTLDGAFVVGRDGDFDEVMVSNIEQWWRWAQTGEQFDHVAAAGRLNQVTKR
ncbi:MAG: hypothetical protein WAW62_04640 [Candidatus Saccharimonas aalborgensis]